MLDRRRMLIRRRQRRRRLVLAVAVLAICGGGASALALGGAFDDAAATKRPPSTDSPSTDPTASAPATMPPAPKPSYRAPRPFPGFLMIADRGNSRALLVDGRRRILWRYPRPGHAPALPFRYDDDVFFTPGFRSIISNQEDQETVQVIGFPSGRLVWHYGHVDAIGSAAGYLNNPDDAYMLPDGRISVADPRNCRVLILSRAHKILRQYGQPGNCGHDPPRLLASPNGDTPLPGGGMLISEIGGSWIDKISASGRLVWSVRAPIAYPSDAQMLHNGRILVADYSDPGHVLIMSHSGHVFWKYGPTSGQGQLNHPSLALMLPNGLIAVNDDYRDRVVLIDPATSRIVWQYGHTDQPGTAPGYLNTPDGMDFLPLSQALSQPQLKRLVRRSLVLTK
jgi:outer membrane protein assembly factor BamB